MGIARAIAYMELLLRSWRGARPCSDIVSACSASLGLLAAALGMHAAPLAAAEPYDPWPGLVQDIFNNRPMNDGAT